MPRWPILVLMGAVPGADRTQWIAVRECLALSAENRSDTPGALHLANHGLNPSNRQRHRCRQSCGSCHSGHVTAPGLGGSPGTHACSPSLTSVDRI